MGEAISTVFATQWSVQLAAEGREEEICKVGSWDMDIRNVISSCPTEVRSPSETRQPLPVSGRAMVLTFFTELIFLMFLFFNNYNQDDEMTSDPAPALTCVAIAAQRGRC